MTGLLKTPRVTTKHLFLHQIEGTNTMTRLIYLMIFDIRLARVYYVRYPGFVSTYLRLNTYIRQCVYS